ncbi:piggyBac transposable element-derived protein 3-like [Homalodisca vitripennis]|uniref:piggyBac transposable element-derived protein 3-like n=1 Tax=Homalodisca vitripennis TaxID=197043 RepID=UPI001EEB63A2|nr:piggyBac transposable element-derived protein 3-like [Homalodisca vitripennis]
MTATGTVRANRTEKCPLNDKKMMSIRERGSFESYIDKSDNIAAVAWKDNSVVTLLSNEHGVAPLGEAKRYSVTERKKVSIPQPYRIAQYNRNMGGVDLMDNKISNYRIGVRGKRWYIPIVLWLFDVVMSNTWFLARSQGVTLDSLFPKKCGPGFTSKIWTRS